VPGPTHDDLLKLFLSFGIVAVVAMCIAVVAWFISGKNGISQSCAWRVWPTRWTIFDAVAMWLLAPIQSLVATGGIVVIAIAPPIAVFTFRFWRRFMATEPWTSNDVSFGRVAKLTLIGIIGWAVITPLTFGVYLLTLWLFVQLGGEVEQHPLSTTPPQTLTAAILLFAKACYLAPVFEELAFRRVLVPWAMGQSYRAWLILAASVPFAVARLFSPVPMIGPAIFLVILVLGFVGVQYAKWLIKRFPVRTASAIYSTSAFFAIVHSLVWPSPIPLFILGLGLGYLMVRTHSVWPCVVAHALFNAVSAVFLLSNTA
jgi:membrane protease YdiL (CAAX protease family)